MLGWISGSKIQTLMIHAMTRKPTALRETTFGLAVVVTKSYRCSLSNPRAVRCRELGQRDHERLQLEDRWEPRLKSAWDAFLDLCRLIQDSGAQWFDIKSRGSIPWHPSSRFRYRPGKPRGPSAKNAHTTVRTVPQRPLEDPAWERTGAEAPGRSHRESTAYERIRSAGVAITRGGARPDGGCRYAPPLILGSPQHRRVVID
eukprot:scaffold1997_cov318-Pavlova_lutheri.AAC.8